MGFTGIRAPLPLTVRIPVPLEEKRERRRDRGRLYSVALRGSISTHVFKTWCSQRQPCRGSPARSGGAAPQVQGSPGPSQVLPSLFHFPGITKRPKRDWSRWNCPKNPLAARPGPDTACSSKRLRGRGDQRAGLSAGGHRGVTGVSVVCQWGVRGRVSGVSLGCHWGVTGVAAGV